MPYKFFDEQIKRVQWERLDPLPSSATHRDVLYRAQLFPNFWDPVEYVKRCPTRVLMDYMKTMNICPFDRLEVTNNHRNGGVFWITRDQVKAELKDRPHVPNKREAKQMRRLAAQGKVRQVARLKRAWNKAVPKTGQV